MDDESDADNAGPHWKRRAVEKKIAENEVHLTAARRAVQGFEEKRYELKELLNSTTPIMSSLPVDILSEIFIITTCSQLTYQRKKRPVQFLIGRICRAWRRIAWSTQSLWGEVCLELSKDRWETQKHLLQDWIERGGSSPLELNFLVPRDQQNWDPPSDIFQPIMTSCHRWTKLSCHRAFRNLALLLAQEERQFPLLSNIIILHNGKTSLSQQYLTKWNFHSATPQLRRLHLPNSTPGPDLGVNWACLTELCFIFEFSSGRSSELLGLVPSLQTLGCTLRRSSADLANIHLPIYHLPHLQEISLTGETRLVMLLLSSFTTPALKSLTLHLDGGGPSLLWTTTITELTRRSSCSLTDLDLEQNNLTDEVHILDMLRQLSPSVTTLRLDCSSFSLSNTTIDYLNLSLQRNDGRPEECLPYLESFTYFGEVSFTLKAMSRLLKSRARRPDSENVSPRTTPSELEIEEMDTSSSASHPPNLSVTIYYTNIEWFQAKHPNDIRKFFEGLALHDGVDLELESMGFVGSEEGDYDDGSE